MGIFITRYLNVLPSFVEMDFARPDGFGGRTWQTALPLRSTIRPSAMPRQVAPSELVTLDDTAKEVALRNSRSDFALVVFLPRDARQPW
jgi:hypothetical protein